MYTKNIIWYNTNFARKSNVFTMFVVSAVDFMIWCDGKHNAKARTVNENYKSI